MFIENKYRRWYLALMERARDRKIIGYTERHHILPRSLGGTNKSDNLVRLTYREHYLAHWLLIKFTNGLFLRKMKHALAQMGYQTVGERQIASWRFEVARKAHVSALVGKKHSEESRRKMSLSSKGRVISVAQRVAMSLARKGKPGTPHTDASRLKISLGNSGKPRSLEHRNSISKTLTGRKLGPHKALHRARISAAHKGRKHTEEHRQNNSKAQKEYVNLYGYRDLNLLPPKFCEHCGKCFKTGMYARWHGSRCKSLHNEFLCSNVIAAALGFGA